MEFRNHNLEASRFCCPRVFNDALKENSNTVRLNFLETKPDSMVIVGN